MRVAIGLSFLLVMTITGAPAAESGQKVATQRVASTSGVKTPGVQIPFAGLKSEMEYDASGLPWIGVTDTILIANGDRTGLLRIDTKAKEPKFGDPIGSVKQPCAGVVSAFGSLWVGSCGDRTLARIDPKTSKVTASVASGIGTARVGLAASADSIWLLTDARGTLSRIDPQQNEVVAEFRVYADCGALTFGEAALWLACPAENRVLRIDPQTNLVDKSIEVSAQPEALAIGENSVWVLCAKDGKVERIDPKTNKVTKTIELGAAASAGTIAFGEGSVWISMPAFPLTRIDPQTDKVVQQFYGAGAGVVQTGLGSVWLAGADSGKLLRFDPRRIAATLAE